jgi:hypothetical protein
MLRLLLGMLRGLLRWLLRGLLQMLLQMRGLLRGLLRGMPKNQNCERYLQPVAGLMIQQAREVSNHEKLHKMYPRQVGQD